ncbi:MAG: hypothetical protein AABW59_03570 [archaeon]
MPGVNRQRVQDARFERTQLHRNFMKRRSKIVISNPRSIREKEMARLIMRKKEQIRSFKKMIPRELVKVPSDGSGVNYVYQTRVNGKPVTVTFDFKFSYGESGLRHIGLRVKNRRLDNAADWAMIMDRSGHIEMFRMDHVRNFVKTKWGSVSQKNRIEKKGYTVFPVSLDAILGAEGVNPIICELKAASISLALQKVAAIEAPKEVVEVQAKTTKQLIQKRTMQSVFPTKKLRAQKRLASESGSTRRMKELDRRGRIISVTTRNNSGLRGK